MIQLSTLPSPAPGAPLPGAMSGAEPQGAADFAAFLNHSKAPEGEGGKAAAGPGEAPLRQPPAAPAMPAGKILPVLPGMMIGSAALQGMAAESLPAEPQAAAVPGLTAAAANRVAAKAMQAPAPGPRAARPGHMAPAPASEATDGAEEPIIAISAKDLTISANSAIAAPPAGAEAAAPAAPSAQGASADAPLSDTPPLPALIAAQMHGLPLAAARRMAPQPVPAGSAAQAEAASAPAAEQVRLLPASALRPDIAPGAANLAVGEAAPEPAAGAIHLRLGAGAAKEAMVALPASSDAGLAPALVLPAAMDAAPLADAAPTGPAAAPAEPGHDFAAIVDRLIEARDAVRPQAVNVALDHAEFGQVSLQFRHDEGGLSVSVASADPDFARAVQAAVPPAAASAQADAGAGQNGGQNGAFASARPDGAPSQPGTGQQGQGHARPQSAAAGDARRPDANPTASTPFSEAPAERRGRFA